MEPSIHVPVLLEECLQGLAPRPGGIFLDGTLGGGGHARAVASAVIPGGRVVGIDRDPAAVARCAAGPTELPLTAVQGSYADAAALLEPLGLGPLDGILLDLGLSSDQLADRERGFSFQEDGPLDLRFDPTVGDSAAELVRTMPEKELADLIYRYGEERHSRRIARNIVAARREAPVTTTEELAAIIRRSLPGGRSRERLNPATRTFQALRIAVNGELEELAAALERLPDLLRPGGRLAIISFHSLEDRPVKEAFRDDPRLERVTKKPIRASGEEVARNSRARSAKLRIAERRG